MSAHVFEVCILITVGLGAGLTFNQLRDKPLPLTYESKFLRLEKAVANLSSPVPPGTKAHYISLPATVTLEQLQLFMKEKRGLVIDARPEIFHRLGHIPGAISLPREDFENAYSAFRHELEQDKAQPVIAYCSNPSCEDSTLVQKSLNALGFTNVAVFTGGWAEWQERNLPEEIKP